MSIQNKKLIYKKNKINMKYLKLYEKFTDQKWILRINENIIDKIEDLVKGKSDKGKIIEEFLTRNEIKTKGTAYMIHFLGGSEPGKKELSHPFDYLQYTPGVASITKDGLLVINDEKSKTLQVPDTLSFLSVIEKDEIVKNWTWGLKQGCSVKKADYEFDLSKEVPTMTLKESMYSIPQQKWNPSKEEVVNLDDDISEFSEEDVLSFKTPIKMITLQQWVDELNKTGWIKKDPKYFSQYIKSETVETEK